MKKVIVVVLILCFAITCKVECRIKSEENKKNGSDSNQSNQLQLNW